MRPVRAALGSVLFFVVAPGFVAGVGPWLVSRWRPGPCASAGLRWAGGLLLAAGVLVLVATFVRFAQAGGTPSPTHPTEHLVVSGLYRHTRNPMYLGLLATILGQALLLGRWDLLVYSAVAAAAVYVRVLRYEEPTLERRFGDAYRHYAAAVPRWGVRWRAWRGPE